MYRIIFLNLVLFLAVGQAWAQSPSFEDEELRRFGETFEKIRTSGDAKNWETFKVFALEEGMDEARLETLMGQMLRNEAPKLTPEEDQVFARVKQRIEAQELVFQEKREALMREAGFTPERYAEIMQAYRKDSRLQNRIYRLLNP